MKEKYDSPIKIVQACQDHLVESHSSLHGPAGNYPTSYGSLYPYGFKDKLNQQCLWGISDLPCSDRLGFYIFHQAKDTESNRRYMSYILDPERSPWRDIIRRQEKQDLDFVMKYGYVLTDFSFAGNFFFNFLTTFRLSYEKPWCIQFWEDLMKAGVRPGTALAFTSVCYLFNSAALTYTSDTGHNAFSMYRADMESLNRINNGKPDARQFLPTNFTDSSLHLPCNTVWSGNSLIGPPGELFRAMQSFILSGGKAVVADRRFSNPQEVSIMTVTPTFEQLRDFLVYIEKEEKLKEAA